MTITFTAGLELEQDLVLSATKPLALAICGTTGGFFEKLGAEVRVLLHDDCKELGYSTVESMALSYLRNAKCIYYAHNGHGSEDRFWWGNWEELGLTADQIYNVMFSFWPLPNPPPGIGRPPITFAILTGCDSMSNSQNSIGKPIRGTFAYALTKGGQPNSAVVGYSGLNSVSESWVFEAIGDTKNWNLDYLLRGYPVYKSYLLARKNCAAKYNGYVAEVWQFIGDKSDSFRLVPQQEFPEEEL